MPLRYGIGLSKTVFDQEYYEESIRAHMDNLNLLYVGLHSGRRMPVRLRAPDEK